MDEDPARIEDIAGDLNLDIAQLHGHETPDLHPHDIRIWRAFRVKDAHTPVPDYPAEAIMIDGGLLNIHAHALVETVIAPSGFLRASEDLKSNTLTPWNGAWRGAARTRA